MAKDVDNPDDMFTCPRQAWDKIKACSPWLRSRGATAKALKCLMKNKRLCRLQIKAEMLKQARQKHQNPEETPPRGKGHEVMFKKHLIP